MNPNGYPSDLEPHRNWKIIPKRGNIVILHNMTRSQAVAYSFKTLKYIDATVEPYDDGDE